MHTNAARIARGYDEAAPVFTVHAVAPATADSLDVIDGGENDNSPVITLSDLVGRFCYVATPYTNYPYGHAAAAYDAARVTAALMRMGICAVSPIAHSHAVAHVGNLDKVDGEFWQRMDAPLVRAAEACIVVKLPGWDTSKGVTHEIAEFERAGKPIVYLDDGEVG